jgi:hypothetical protein
MGSPPWEAFCYHLCTDCVHSKGMYVDNVLIIVVMMFISCKWHILPVIPKVIFGGKMSRFWIYAYAFFLI